jgi:hypothetical protein
MSDQPLYPHTQQDGELDRLRLCCNRCGKSVSTPFYPVKTDTPDTGLIVRAFIECPECFERETSQAPPPAIIAMNAVCQNPPWEFYGVFDSERCFFCGRDRSINHDLALDDEGQHEADCAWWLWRQDAVLAAVADQTS